MTPIKYDAYRSVSGFNQRVRFLVMHYTALDFAGSVTALAGAGRTSAHYLVPDPTDASYIAAGYKEVTVFNLVDEKDRAWHAGLSRWRDRNNLNDTSIGIEIVNLARESGGGLVFPPYEPRQIDAVKDLARHILARYPDIVPVNVVGHSDIAVGRKSDPGPRFPWRELYEAGVGAWYQAETVDAITQRYGREGMPPREAIVAGLKKYGYDVSGAASDAGYRNLVRAFQLHFRPDKYDGVPDVETVAILFGLLDKYYPA